MIRAIARVPLTVRVPALVAALIVLVGLVASQQVLAELTRGQEARLRELVRLHVDGLSVALGPAVLRQDVRAVYDTLDRATQAGAARRMILTVVADPDDRILASSDTRRAPLGGHLDDLKGSASALPVAAIRLAFDVPHVRVRTPLLHQGRAVGSILTELDVADLVAERRRTRRALLAFNGAVTLALALVGYVAVRRMMRPVAVLARHMGAGGGDPVPIPESQMPAGDPEMARLFRTYNGMTGAIRDRAEVQRRLAERDRLVSLGRLSSSLAHEINNPLSGLLNAADTIRTYPDRPQIVRNSVDLLLRGLTHMRDVATAILDHNRLDRTGAALTREDFDDLRLLVSPEFQRLGQRLSWTLEATPRDLGRYPAAPLRQIALNLLLNASAAAGRNGTVGLEVRPADGGLVLKVTDNGAGLPEPARARLLAQGDATGGGDIGLGVVRDLVRDLGGWIAHRRAAGSTTLCVTLPAARSDGRA